VAGTKARRIAAAKLDLLTTGERYSPWKLTPPKGAYPLGGLLGLPIRHVTPLNNLGSAKRAYAPQVVVAPVATEKPVVKKK
jgi:hypothetical protein